MLQAGPQEGGPHRSSRHLLPLPPPQPRRMSCVYGGGLGRNQDTGATPTNSASCDTPPSGMGGGGGKAERMRHAGAHGKCSQCKRVSSQLGKGCDGSHMYRKMDGPPSPRLWAHPRPRPPLSFTLPTFCLIFFIILSVAHGCNLTSSLSWTPWGPSVPNPYLPHDPADCVSSWLLPRPGRCSCLFPTHGVALTSNSPLRAWIANIASSRKPSLTFLSRLWLPLS